MKIHIILLLIMSAFGYVLLNSVEPIFPKLLKPCNGIDQRLLESANEASSMLSKWGFDVTVSGGSSLVSGSICNKGNIHYGYMTPYINNTAISISNKLLSYPNTLYNVVLHEILHSLGLDHSPEDGLMSYAVTQNWFGGVEDDDRKLWLSIDDLLGLINLKYKNIAEI